MRSRTSCPKPLQDNLLRASTQDFKAVTKPKLPDDWLDMVLTCQPTKERTEAAVDMDILGSTGNIYTVTLDFRPTCTCPNFVKKEDICKHIFFVLKDLAGLSRNSPIIYQKAYLSSELVDIYEGLSTFSGKSSGKMAGKAIRSACKQRKSTTSESVYGRCDLCDKKIKSHSSRPGNNVICCRCGGKFHASCLVMPDLHRLTVSSGSKSSKKLIGTTHVTCPLCDEQMDYDEGYVNMADVTGQHRIRDTSTYRPCPGYPGYHGHRRVSHY